MFAHKLINKQWGVLVLPRTDTMEYINLPEPDVRAESAVQQYPLGTALITDDGVFRYAKNGGVAVLIGKLLQQAAAGNAAWVKDIAVRASVAVGATTIDITTPTGDLTANQLKDGYVFVNDCGAATGEGAVYKIKSHPAASATASCILTLVDPIVVALTTASELGVRKNIYDSVVVNPTTQTGIPVGVVNHASFTISYFAWIKTKGIVAILTSGTLVLGNPCTIGASVAGAVDPYNEDGSGNLAIVGTVIQVGADTEYSLVKVDLDPSW